MAAMTIAEATWVATALLHQEDVAATDFSVSEIKEKAISEGLVDPTRAGLQVHISKHCVANKSANPATHRMLFKTKTGRRRLFRELTDNNQTDPGRKSGKILPAKSDLPPRYQDLIDWYQTTYAPSLGNAASATNGETTQKDPIPPTENAEMITSSIKSLAGMFAKPMMTNSAGDLVIPRRFLDDLGVQDGVPLSIRREADHIVVQPITEDFLNRLVGSCKGDTDLVEAREREHRMER